MEDINQELLKVLAAREQRWEMRRKLVKEKRRCLITVTLCIPIVYRTDDEFCTLFQYFCRTFLSSLILNGHHAYFEDYICGEDGPAFFISIETEAKSIKRICVKVEENVTGARMLDIDVMDIDGTPVGREDIAIAPRRCFICDNSAMVCVSKRRHSPDEISTCVEQLKEKMAVSSHSLTILSSIVKE
ncbi:citrate lyase holo-[acyl-carrier protein] synthase [Petroclostridium sp. X23]|uniref:citrate lyase holo-[acyl-carrier protein] synthase n=1 Tax=Petroclostridium sp. X23 TaxID=3045146 RepID=UPI0024AE00A2|nr:citrate lyase holo-[acyl-carrier protein] synthase [Petroclostridium sp. X23]WHH61194.1 citrate lyase holo-[acyl-carrier protein] synthase [Petroclostridium sp. X23]